MSRPESYLLRKDFARYISFLSKWVDLPNLEGLEIGPLDKPLLSKNKYAVQYLDIFPEKVLIERCRANSNRDENSVVPLDYVIGNKQISEVVKHKFDYVVASHVIEHQPNMLGWLRDLTKILSANGKLFLIIPDRRFTFDLHRPLSSLGELIDNDRHQLIKPSFKSAFDQRYYHRQVSSHEIWKAKNNNQQIQIEPTFNFHNAYEFALRTENEHLDVHCNIFEPKSFFELIDSSLKLSLQPFKCTHLEETRQPFLDFIVLLEIN